MGLPPGTTTTSSGVTGTPRVRLNAEGHRLQGLRRGLEDPRLLASGPGRLCQALAITGAHDGLSLDAPPFELHERSGPVEVVAGVRVGITRATDLPWRYAEAGSRFLSRPLRPA